MDLQTFTLFPLLPTELQLHIFSLAASSLPLTEVSWLISIRCVYWFFFDNQPCRTRHHWPSQIPIYTARLTMMWTCRLSRLVVLETWKREIRECEVGNGRIDELELRWSKETIESVVERMRWQVRKRLDAASAAERN